jgi:hypothetical protein
VQGQVVSVASRYGRMEGRPNGPVAGAVKLVVPSEAFFVEARGGGQEAAGGVNRLAAVIEARERIGNMVGLRIALDDDTRLRIEGHGDRFPPGLSAGAPAWLSWDAASASVIAERR